MRLAHFAAVLLDMDGTLVDSESLWRVAEHDFAARHGFSLEPAQQDCFIGQTVTAVMTYLKAQHGLPEDVPALEQELETVVKALLPEVKEQPGTTQLIELLKDYNVSRAIVSNSTHAIIAKTLEQQAWAKDIPQRFSADDVKKGKPEPDSYLLAAQTLNALPERCLVIEDSLTGAEAAIRAGMTCCLLTHGLPAHGLPLHSEHKAKTLTPLLFESLYGVLEWLQVS
ncbi:MAG: HAD family hydrolase [Trueperaceae bacterium]